MTDNEEIALLKTDILELKGKVEKIEKFVDRNFYTDNGFAGCNHKEFESIKKKLDILQDTLAQHLNIPAKLLK